MLDFTKPSDDSFRPSLLSVTKHLHGTTRLRKQAYAFVFGAMCVWTQPLPAVSDPQQSTVPSAEVLPAAPQPATSSPEVSQPAAPDTAGAPSAKGAAEARLDDLERQRERLDRKRDRLDRHSHHTRRLTKIDHQILALDKKIAHERRQLGPSSEGPDMSNAEFTKLQGLEARRMKLERERLTLERRNVRNDSARLTRLDRQINRLDKQIERLTDDRSCLLYTSPSPRD